MPQKDLLNESNILNMASVLSVEVTLISLATAPSLSERIIPVAVYHTNPLVTVPDFYLVPAPHLASTIYRDEVITNVL